MKLLTQEETNNLPLGQKIKIKWSGGQEFYNYKIKDKVGELNCVKKFSLNCGWWYGQIDFVGKESYHTQVILRK